MLFRSTATCVLVAPLLLAAAKPVSLAPSSQWVLDYAENSCRLIRTFGEGDSKTVLLMESEAPYHIDMLVVGKPLRSYTEDVSLAFVPSDERPIIGRTAKSSENGVPAVLWTRISFVSEDAAEGDESKSAKMKWQPGVRPPAIDLEKRAALRFKRRDFVAKTTAFKVDTGRNHWVVLETGSLAEPIRKLDECSVESLRDWGVDPALEEKIVKRAWSPDSSKWLRSADYPTRRMQRGEESLVKARLLVDASGKVTKCTSLSHFDAPEFNKAVCQVYMSRASFQPAELADGTAVPSYYTVRVQFRMQ